MRSLTAQIEAAERETDASVYPTSRPTKLRRLKGPSEDSADQTSALVPVGYPPARRPLKGGRKTSGLASRTSAIRNQIGPDRRTAAAPGIRLGRCGIDSGSIGIEGLQHSSLVEPHVGLNALQRRLGDEERRLNGAVVAPKPHRAARARSLP